MKIEHRISLNVGRQEKDMLQDYGINIDEGFKTFFVDEDNQYWQELSRLIKVWKAVDIVQTKFTKNEIDGADNIAVYPKWLNDFPQPENDYLAVSYDLTNYCSSCGTGKVQKAPLRIKNEPGWGNNLLFSLNWIYDEFFVKRDFYNKMFQPLGIACREVFLHKKDVVSESAVQLVLPITAASLNMVDRPFSKCSKCGNKKYEPISKGFFPSFEKTVDMPMFKSQEYFGSGATADRRIFAGRELKDKLIYSKVNVTVYPCGTVVAHS
jgi:hypothetical protein